MKEKDNNPASSATRAAFNEYKNMFLLPKF